MSDGGFANETFNTYVHFSSSFDNQTFRVSGGADSNNPLRAQLILIRPDAGSEMSKTYSLTTDTGNNGLYQKNLGAITDKQVVVIGNGNSHNGDGYTDWDSAPFTVNDLPAGVFTRRRLVSQTLRNTSVNPLLWDINQGVDGQGGYVGTNAGYTFLVFTEIVGLPYWGIKA